MSLVVFNDVLKINCKIQDLISQCNQVVESEDMQSVKSVLKEIECETKKQSSILTQQISEIESQRKLDEVFCDYIRAMKYDNYM